MTNIKMVRGIVSAFFLVLLVGGLKAQSNETPDIGMPVPAVPYRVFVVIAGSPEKAFNWKWESLPLASLDGKVEEAMQNDLKRLQSEDTLWRKFSLPAKIESIYVNPSNHLHYVVLVPNDERKGRLDMNVLYVYDPKSKAIIFRTYADPEW